jgi:hypothetical protein
MSYRLHRKKKELGISAWFGILEKKKLYFCIFWYINVKNKKNIILIYF